MKVLALLLFFQAFNSTEELVEYTLPAVVKILTPYGSGSGVIVKTDGYVLTNYHVIEGANSNEIIIKSSEGTNYKVLSIVDYDADLDLALLRTEDLSAEAHFELADSENVKLGQKIIVIGNPLGLTNYITEGIISKYNTPYLFISASINPGNSGGAVINMNGELVGIPTLSFTETQNINVAMCPRTIRYFLEINGFTQK